MKKVMAVGCVMASMVGLADGEPATSYWQAEGNDGDYSLASNWTLGVPSNGVDGIYGAVKQGDSDVTLRFPAGTYRENGYFYALRAKSGSHRTVTFDFSNSDWYKDGCTWPANWRGFQLSGDVYNSHYFNFENLANGSNVFHFANGRLVYDTAYNYVGESGSETYARITLESGSLEVYYPNILYIGGGNPGGEGVSAYFKPETTTSINNLTLRPNGKTRVYFEGGTHTINNLVLGDGNAGAGYSTLNVTGGTFTVSGAVSGGNNTSANTSTGIWHVANNANVFVGSGIYQCTGSSKGGRNGMIIEVTDDARFENYRSLNMGHRDNTVGQLKCSGNSITLLKGTSQNYAFTAGSAAGSQGDIFVSDNAQVKVSKISFLAGNSANTVGTLTISDHGNVTFAQGATICLSAGSDTTGSACITLQDDGVLDVEKVVFREHGTGFRADLRLEGGTLKTQSIDGAGDGILTADGGAILASNVTTAVAPLLTGFSAATLGAGGLTLDAVAETVINQALTDDTEAATTGAFTKEGAATLTVLSTSRHAKTTVTEGALVFGSGVTAFGENVTMDAGTKLVIPGDANFTSLALTADATMSLDGVLTLAKLTADDASTRAIVRLGSAGKIVVTSEDSDAVTLGRGLRIELTDARENGAYDVLTFAGTAPEGLVDKMRIVNPESGKSYVFGLSANGKALTVTIADNTEYLTWKGGSGAWGTSANWSPARVPQSFDRTIFPVGTGTVTIDDDERAVNEMDVKDDYTFTSDASLELNGMVTVAADKTARFETPLVADTKGASGKDGAGKMTITHANPEYRSTFTLTNGVLDLAAALPFGTNDETRTFLTKAGTCVKVAAGVTTEVPRSFAYANVSDGGTNAYPTHFAIDGRLTMAGNPSVAKAEWGSLVKTGTGEFEFSVPGSGDFYLTRGSNPTVANNGLVTGVFTPAEDGTLSNWTGLGECSIYDGTMTVRGTGSKLPHVMVTDFIVLGGNYKEAQSEEVRLEIDHVKFEQGIVGGRHFSIANQIPKESAVKRVTMTMKDSEVIINGLKLGAQAGTRAASDVALTLAITNSTLNNTWSMTLPGNSSFTDCRIIISQNGVLKNSVEYSDWSAGLIFSSYLQLYVEDDGAIVHDGKDNRVIFTGENASAWFRRGGRLSVTELVVSSSSQKMIFDAGVLEFLRSDASHMTRPDLTYLEIASGGMEVRVGAGISHAITFPMKGEGCLTKTGAGELILATGLKGIYGKFKPNISSQGITNTVPSGIVTAQQTGGTKVSEGLLSVQTDAVAATMDFDVCSGAALNLSGATITCGSVSGAGVISNGTLSAGIRVPASATADDVPTFKDVTLVGHNTIDFGATDTYEPVRGVALPVAKFGDGVDATSATWHVMGAGENVFGKCALTDGILYATLKRAGTVVIVR